MGELIDHIKEHRRHHQDSLDHAVDGLKWAIRTQPNFKFHFFFSLCVIFLGIVYSISQAEWALIFLTVTFGLAMEMFNTVAESLTDLIKKEYDTDAKIVKDVAAAMMFIAAIGAAIVGGVIFIPRFINCFLG